MSRCPPDLVQGAWRIGCLGSAATCRASTGGHPSQISRRITADTDRGVRVCAPDPLASAAMSLGYADELQSRLPEQLIRRLLGVLEVAIGIRFLLAGLV